MDEEERELFLNSFREDNRDTLVGFAVLGGIFSEGIDLTGDRLVGTIIVGVGLPQICIENNIIKDYFEEKDNAGFEYAYVYPGMNKVLQAAGRVIRTEKDRGIILLIDDRFTSKAYNQLFPRDWQEAIQVNNSMELERYLRRFW
jgi:DNA excision repair protein ERCC-2